MTFRIKPEARERYSNNELRILGALQVGRCNTAELLEAVYSEREPPPNAATGINAILATLRSKVNINNEDFIVLRTPQRGAGKRIEYWLEARKGDEHPAACVTAQSRI